MLLNGTAMPMRPPPVQLNRPPPLSPLQLITVPPPPLPISIPPPPIPGVTGGMAVTPTAAAGAAVAPHCRPPSVGAVDGGQMSDAVRELVERAMGEVMSRGLFDNFRRECLSDVDTRPAYQNLHLRVVRFVRVFLRQQKWSPDLNRNHLRERMGRQLLLTPFLDAGVSRIVDQVVDRNVCNEYSAQVKRLVRELVTDSSGRNVSASEMGGGGDFKKLIDSESEEEDDDGDAGVVDPSVTSVGPWISDYIQRQYGDWCRQFQPESETELAAEKGSSRLSVEEVPMTGAGDCPASVDRTAFNDHGHYGDGDRGDHQELTCDKIGVEARLENSAVRQLLSTPAPSQADDVTADLSDVEVHSGTPSCNVSAPTSVRVLLDGLEMVSSSEHDDSAEESERDTDSPCVLSQMSPLSEVGAGSDHDVSASLLDMMGTEDQVRSDVDVGAVVVSGVEECLEEEPSELGVCSSVETSVPPCAASTVSDVGADSIACIPSELDGAELLRDRSESIVVDGEPEHTHTSSADNINVLETLEEDSKEDESDFVGFTSEVLTEAVDSSDVVLVGPDSVACSVDEPAIACTTVVDNGAVANGSGTQNNAVAIISKSAVHELATTAAETPLDSSSAVSRLCNTPTPVDKHASTASSDHLDISRPAPDHKQHTEITVNMSTKSETSTPKSTTSTGTKSDGTSSNRKRSRDSSHDKYLSRSSSKKHHKSSSSRSHERSGSSHSSHRRHSSSHRNSDRLSSSSQSQKRHVSDTDQSDRENHAATGNSSRRQHDNQHSTSKRSHHKPSSHSSSSSKKSSSSEFRSSSSSHSRDRHHHRRSSSHRDHSTSSTSKSKCNKTSAAEIVDSLAVHHESADEISSSQSTKAPPEVGAKSLDAIDASNVSAVHVNSFSNDKLLVRTDNETSAGAASSSSCLSDRDANCSQHPEICPSDSHSSPAITIPSDSTNSNQTRSSELSTDHRRKRNLSGVAVCEDRPIKRPRKHDQVALDEISPDIHDLVPDTSNDEPKSDDCRSMRNKDVIKRGTADEISDGGSNESVIGDTIRSVDEVSRSSPRDVFDDTIVGSSCAGDCQDSFSDKWLPQLVLQRCQVPSAEVDSTVSDQTPYSATQAIHTVDSSAVVTVSAPDSVEVTCDQVSPVVVGQDAVEGEEPYSGEISMPADTWEQVRAWQLARGALTAADTDRNSISSVDTDELSEYDQLLQLDVQLADDFERRALLRMGWTIVPLSPAASGGGGVAVDSDSDTDQLTLQAEAESARAAARAGDSSLELTVACQLDVTGSERQAAAEVGRASVPSAPEHVPAAATGRASRSRRQLPNVNYQALNSGDNSAPATRSARQTQQSSPAAAAANTGRTRTSRRTSKRFS